MSSSEKKYVTQEILGYYDSKLKEYIDTKVNSSNQDVNGIEDRLSSVETAVAVNSANISANREDIDEVETSLINLADSVSDIRVALENKVSESVLQDFITKEFLNNGYFTKEQVIDRIKDAIDSIEKQDTSAFVTRTELDTMFDNVVVKGDLSALNSSVSSIETALEYKADKEYVLEEITKAALSGTVDLTNYYNKDTIDAKLETINTQMNELSLKDSELVRLGVSHENRIDDLEKSLGSMASIEYVNEQISSIEFPKQPTKLSDLINDTGYISENEARDIVENAIDNIDIPQVDLTGYATKSDLSQATSTLATKEELSSIETTLETEINNIHQNYVTNDYIQTQNFVTNTYIEQNYSTTEQIANTYVTEETVTELVTTEVNTVVTEQIETKVTEVIQEKIDSGEINPTVDSIKYDTWD